MLRDLYQKIARRYRKAFGPAGSRSWTLYVLDGHSPSQFYLECVRDVLGSRAVFIDPREELRNACSDGLPFMYIGHGEPAGVFSSIGFSEGLRNVLCDFKQIEHVKATPHVWWACFTATWLQRCRRRDWYGFGDLIGFDPRRGQRDWWRNRLTLLFDAVIGAAEGTDPAARALDVAEQNLADAEDEHYRGGKLSYSTLLCAALYRRGITVPQEGDRP